MVQGLPNFNPFPLLGLRMVNTPPTREELASLKRAVFRRLLLAGQLSVERSTHINVAHDYLCDNLQPAQWRDLLTWARAFSPVRTQPPPSVAEASSTAGPSTSASAQPGTSANPVDLVEEGTAVNPYDLTSESDEDAEHEDPVVDEEKGLCVGSLRGTNYSVFARVMAGTRGQRIGFRVHEQDMDGNLLPKYTGRSIVRFGLVDLVGPYANKSERDVKAILRAILF